MTDDQYHDFHEKVQKAHKKWDSARHRLHSKGILRKGEWHADAVARVDALEQKYLALDAELQEEVKRRYGNNPLDVWTAKGERMYQDVKAGYGKDPRAEEIAARTVWAEARRGVPGLIRAGYKYGPAKRNHDMEDDIIEGVATALWASAFATWGEEAGETPGAGGDWVEFSAPVPAEVYEDARALVELIKRDNDVEDIDYLLYMAAGADHMDSEEVSAEYAADFGHYLAMMSLGEGVSWFDDHEMFPIELPHIEAWTDDGEFLQTSGIPRPNQQRARRIPEKKPRIRSGERRRMPRQEFAFPQWKKEPLNTKGRIRAAMARFDQVEDPETGRPANRLERRAAYRRILSAARTTGIDPSGFKERWESRLG